MQIHMYDYIYTFLIAWSYFIMQNTVTVLLEMCYINKLLTYITVFVFIKYTSM